MSQKTVVPLTQDELDKLNDGSVVVEAPTVEIQIDNNRPIVPLTDDDLRSVESSPPKKPDPYVPFDERIEVDDAPVAPVQEEPQEFVSLRDLENDDDLVEDILQYRLDRFGVEKDEGAVNLLTGAFTGFSQEQTNENIIDDFLDHHRFLISNSVNSIAEVGWLRGLKQKEEAAIEAGDTDRANNFAEQRARARRLYLRADQLGGLFGEGRKARYEGMDLSERIGDTAETVGTYVLSGLSDPLTLITAGVGRVMAGGAAMAGNPFRAALMAAVGAAPAEAGSAAVVDYAVQKAEIEMGVRDTVDYKRTAIVAGVGAATSGVLSAGGATVSALKTDKVTRGELTKALKKNTERQTKAAERTNARLGNESRLIRERLAKGITDVYGADAIVRNKKGEITGIDSKVIRESDYAGRLKDELDLDLDLVAPSLSFSTFERVTASTGEVIEAVRDKKLKLIDGVTGKEVKDFVAPLQKNEMVSERLLNILSNVREDSQDAVADILGKYGITQRELAATLFADASWAGKRLRSLRDLSDIVGRAGRAKTLGEAVEEGEAAAEATFGRLFRRLEDIRRLTLVSGIATAVRNNFSQVLRSGVELPVYALESAINPRKKFGFRNTFAQLEHTFYDPKDAATIAQFMLDLNANQKARFYNQFSEVKNYLNKKNPGQASTSRHGEGLGLGSRFLDGWENLVHSFNYLNRLQEAAYRNGMFTASLQRQLFNEGKDIIEVLNSGKVTENISESMVAKAVDDALEFTYASQPQFAPFRFLNNMIVKSGATLAIPFPRFMFKAMEMTYNYNITGVATALTRMFLQKTLGTDLPGGVAKAAGRTITDGQYKQFAQGLAGGLPLLSLGYFLRDPEGPHSGSEWYMLKDGLGNEFDARPFFPLTPYLLFGEWMHRWQEERPNILRAREAFEGLTGANFRGSGPSGKMLEDLVTMLNSDDLADQRAFTIGIKEAGRYIGEALVGYGQFAFQVGDFVAMDQRMKDYKDDPEYKVGLEGFFSALGAGIAEPFISRIERVKEAAPDIFGFEEQFPYKEDPRFEEVPERVMPFMKILFGATLTRVPPKYVVELNRLGFTYVDFMAKTNSRGLDRVMNREMGKAMQSEMPELLRVLKDDPAMKNEDGSINKNLMKKEINNYISVIKQMNFIALRDSNLEAIHASDLQRFNRLGPTGRKAAMIAFKRVKGRSADFNVPEDVAELIDFGKNHFNTYAKQRKSIPK